jgi:hypothetical protein
MLQQLQIFAEWQNASILILPGAWLEHLMECYPPAADDAKRHLVLNAILSLTSKMYRSAVLPLQERTRESEAAFEAAAARLYALSLRNPCVEVVRAACILACREYGCGHENSAWSLSGIAGTVGNSIVLHAARQYDSWIASGKLSPVSAEARVIAYWATVLIDRMLASCLGRNCVIHAIDYDTPEIRIQHLSVPTESDEVERCRTWRDLSI